MTNNAQRGPSFTQARSVLPGIRRARRFLRIRRFEQLTERSRQNLRSTAGARAANLGTRRGHLAGRPRSTDVPHACQNAEQTAVIGGHSPTVQTRRELHGSRSAPCPIGPDKEEVPGSSPGRPTQVTARQPGPEPGVLLW
jgi:hypothetical protein